MTHNFLFIPRARLSLLVAMLAAISTVAQAALRFRFVVMSDIHINVKAPQAFSDLTQSVNQINATDSIDFVLVTGDIADEGDSASLALAKRGLDSLRVPYYIIEGNHDLKWSESGGLDFRRIFGYERFKFEHKGFLFLGFGCGPLMRMALGHVNPEDIEWLKTELKANGTQGKPVFLVTHIPMLPEDMDNWYDVTDAVRQYPVVAFINGHYHSNRHLSYDGIEGIVNTSNLRQQGRQAGQYNEWDVGTDSISVYTHPVGAPRQLWTRLSTVPHHDNDRAHWASRPDYSVNKQYPSVKEHWHVNLGAGIYSSPINYKGRIITADNLGRLTCFDRKGRQQWQFATGARIIGTPAAEKGIVVAGSADSYIYGIKIKDGSMAWKCRTRRPVVSAVTISKGIAYVGSSDGTFRALRITDGSLLWANDSIRGYVETRPLVTQDKVVFGTWANRLYALDRTTGRTTWVWHTPKGLGMHYSPAAVWPVEAQGKVFIADPERALTAIDIATGRQLWRTKRSKVRESIGISADGKRIYAKTMTDSIVCYSTESTQPEELWASNVGFGYEHATVMLPENEGRVYSSTKDGLVFALDAISGRVLWKHKIGNTLINTVVPLDRRHLLLTNEDGTLAELNIEP